MTKVLVVRHGETEWNKKRLVQGSVDIPLSEIGREQAKKLAQRLKSERIHHIYSSPQQRAKDTGWTIALEHPSTPFTVRPDLAENRMGKLEGMHLDDVRDQYPEKDWNDENFRLKVGAESFEFYLKHFARHLPALFQQHQDKTILLSTHGGKKKAILYSLFPDPQIRSLIQNNHPGNCSLTVIEWNPHQKPTLALYNDMSHLY